MSIEKITSKDDLDDSLYEVRKAYRLLKEYQERILNIVFYIKEKLSMPEVIGDRWFCDPLRKKKNGYLKLFPGMWSWDFMYSYEFEYNFGDVELDENREYSLSIVQVSDTGYYEKEAADKNDISTFLRSDLSNSLFLFILVVKDVEDDWLWQERIEEIKDRLLLSSDTTYCEKGVFASKKYSLSEFIDQGSTNSVLLDFSVLVNAECNVELVKEE